MPVYVKHYPTASKQNCMGALRAMSMSNDHGFARSQFAAIFEAALTKTTQLLHTTKVLPILHLCLKPRQVMTCCRLGLEYTGSTTSRWYASDILPVYSNPRRQHSTGYNLTQRWRIGSTFVVWLRPVSTRAKARWRFNTDKIGKNVDLSVSISVQYSNYIKGYIQLCPIMSFMTSENWVSNVCEDPLREKYISLWVQRYYLIP